MYGSKLHTRILWWTAEALLLSGTVTAGALLSRPGEWHPVALVALLLGVAVAGEWFTIETTHAYLSASLGTMVLAMGQLGPTVAAAAGVAAMVAHCARSRRPPRIWLNNITGYAVAPYLGGWLVRVLANPFMTQHGSGVQQSIVLGIMVLAGVGVLLIVNFAIFALERCINDGRSFARDVRELFVPMLPGELAVAVFATLLLLCYRAVGLSVLFAAIPVLLIFRQLNVALVRSEKRAEDLHARTLQLASIQISVPGMLMDALGLRDPGSLRHAAAVASYGKALAAELGCDEDEQEVVHLSGLLHDIGKVTWSDRLLHPEQLTDADLEIIRRHPHDGFNMVGKLDGFGPVAEGILHHHERIDGGGYPAGLIGKEIPLASRIVAVCSTYDTMTSRDTMGPPMSPPDAMAEMRKIAGTQLDRDLVDRFIELLERCGPTFGQHADYTIELAQDKRAARMAEPRPRAAAPAGSSVRRTVPRVGGRTRRATSRR